MVFLACVVHGYQPHVMYTMFFSSRVKRVPRNERIPESPIYCPHNGFFFSTTNPLCSKETCSILRDMHDFTTIFFSIIGPDYIGPDEATYVPVSSSASILGRLLAKPSASIPDLPTSNDWVYESCRLAALIFCHISFHRSLPSDNSAISSQWPLIRDLCNAIAKTDTSDCWGSMSGSLYWCTIIVLIAMRDESLGGSGNKDENKRYGTKWLRLLATRLSVVLGFQYPDAIIRTLRRSIRV